MKALIAPWTLFVSLMSRQDITIVPGAVKVV